MIFSYLYKQAAGSSKGGGSAGAQQMSSNRIDISIGYTNTPIGLGNHALVIATDLATGKQYATRAGPRLNDQGGCCLIVSKYGFYD